MKNFFKFKAKIIDIWSGNGEQELTLGEIVGDAKAIIIVVVASRDELAAKHYPIYEEMYRAYRERGLQIIAFPCNQFKDGDPEKSETIKRTVIETYQVTFPIMSKIKVVGMESHQLFSWLQLQVNQEIKSNFVKFLLDKHGNVKKCCSATDEPQNLIPELAGMLD